MSSILLSFPYQELANAPAYVPPTERHYPKVHRQLDDSHTAEATGRTDHVNDTFRTSVVGRPEDRVPKTAALHKYGGGGRGARPPSMTPAEEREMDKQQRQQQPTRAQFMKEYEPMSLGDLNNPAGDKYSEVRKAPRDEHGHRIVSDNSKGAKGNSDAERKVRAKLGHREAQHLRKPGDEYAYQGGGEKQHQFNRAPGDGGFSNETRNYETKRKQAYEIRGGKKVKVVDNEERRKRTAQRRAEEYGSDPNGDCRWRT
jgi:hypothetical protein